MFKINKHRFNNHIFSIILFEFRQKFWFFFSQLSLSPHNPVATLRQTFRDPDLGRDRSLGTAVLDYRW
jgi:hypothetical protein